MFLFFFVYFGGGGGGGEGVIFCPKNLVKRILSELSTSGGERAKQQKSHSYAFHFNILIIISNNIIYLTVRY